jgi:hypothetical protein
MVSLDVVPSNACSVVSSLRDQDISLDRLRCLPFEEDEYRRSKRREWTTCAELPLPPAEWEQLPFDELPVIELTGWADAESLPVGLYNQLFFSGNGRNSYFYAAWRRQLRDREGRQRTVAEHMTVVAECCYRRRASDAQTLGVLADWLLQHRIDCNFAGIPGVLEDALGSVVEFRAREAAKQRERRAKRKVKPIPVEKSGEPPQKPVKLSQRVLNAIPLDRPIKAGDLVQMLGIDRRALAQALKAAMKSGTIARVSRGNYRRVGMIAA